MMSIKSTIILIIIALYVGWTGKIPNQEIKAPKSAEVKVVPPVDLSKEIAEAAQKLQPRLSEEDAFMFSTVVINRCPRPWGHIAVAIAFQESSLRPTAINSETGDYGIGQVNAEVWDIKDPQRLLEIKAGTEEMCRILTYKYTKYSDKDWARYHSNRKERRELYRKLVEAHLQQITAEMETDNL